MKKAAFALLSVVLIAVLAAVIFWASSDSRGEIVQVTTVRLSALNTSISTNGKVEAVQEFELNAPFAGVCREIRVHAGEALRKAQAILTIEDPALSAELASARAELEAARLDLEKIRRGPAREELNPVEAEISRLQLELDSTKEVATTNEWLYKRQAISRYELEQSRRDEQRTSLLLEAARARRGDMEARFGERDRQSAQPRLEAAQAKIRYLNNPLSQSILRAPAPGTLYQFDVKDGAYVDAGDLLGRFADLSRLRVRVFVDEAELGRVVPGAAVVILWDAYPQMSWKGAVRRIPSQVVALGSRSVAEVLCSIEGGIGPLIPNVNVDVEIVTEQGPDAPALERAAVLTDGRESFVWMIREGLAVKHAVQTGRGSAELLEITSGLSVGDQVIVPGEVPLGEGMKVRVTGQ